MRFSFDANILIYSIDLEEPRKRTVAIDLLTRAIGCDAIMTSQALGEFLNFVRRRRIIDFAEALDIANRWATLFPIAPTLPRHILDGGVLAHARKLQFWDAVLMTTMSANGVTTLVTEDMQDGAIVAGVRLLDPFNSANHTAIDALLTPALETD